MAKALNALREIDSADLNAPYYAEDARTQVLYFLSNAGTFKGEVAKRIKAELKSMLKPANAKGQAKPTMRES